MGLDQLLELTSAVCVKLLPIFGVIVLFFVAKFLYHLVEVLKQSKLAVESMQATLDTANRELEQLDKPLNTLNELSETVDNVHEVTKHAVRSTLVTIIENFSGIKDWVVKASKKEESFDVDANENRSDADDGK